VASSLVSFFSRAENRDIIHRLLQNGVHLESPGLLEQSTAHLAGKSFVLTGTLSGIAREQAKKMIEASGGRVSSAVSRNTDYVVAGSSPGSKLQRAKELGIHVIDESELQRLVGGTTAE
jgi:DNA ligase (NAD+)